MPLFFPMPRFTASTKAARPQLFFDPHCKYVWAMAFDHSGNLFVATGDSGLIYRVAPDGKGSKFFDTEETHARSMIIDAAGNLIVGTEPGGLVLRITPSGQSFVLYQTNKREVTAVAEHDGLIYASAIGNKPVSVSVTGACSRSSLHSCSGYADGRAPHGHHIRPHCRLPSDR